jgi:NitT/TauT family transport system substrate-binding protein
MRIYPSVLGLLSGALALSAAALAQETLKVAVPQRGAWDTGVPELGQRSGIFKKHGLTLEILYTQGGPEAIQAVISGSMTSAPASVFRRRSALSPRARRFG